MKRLNPIVPRFPVGENAIEHCRFVGRFRHVVRLCRWSELRRRRKEEKDRRDDGNPWQGTRQHDDPQSIRISSAAALST